MSLAVKKIRMDLERDSEENLDGNEMQIGFFLGALNSRIYSRSF